MEKLFLGVENIQMCNIRSYFRPIFRKSHYSQTIPYPYWELTGTTKRHFTKTFQKDICGCLAEMSRVLFAMASGGSRDWLSLHRRYTLHPTAMTTNNPELGMNVYLKRGCEFFFMSGFSQISKNGTYLQIELKTILLFFVHLVRMAKHPILFIKTLFLCPYPN